MKSALKMKVVAAMIAGCMPLAALAVDGPSGAKVDYRVPGKLGEVEGDCLNLHLGWPQI